MKKEDVVKLLYAVAVLLAVGFGIRLAADYWNYTTTLNSAPFYLTIIVRAVEFLLPALAVFIAAKIIARRK